MGNVCIVPIAIYGYVFFPGTPFSTSIWWLTPEERAMALSRLPRTVHEKMTLKSFRQSLRRIVIAWQFWLFIMLFGIGAAAFEKPLMSEFNLWLKDSGEFTLQQVNYYPSISEFPAFRFS